MLQLLLLLVNIIRKTSTTIRRNKDRPKLHETRQGITNNNGRVTTMILRNTQDEEENKGKNEQGKNLDCFVFVPPQQKQNDPTLNKINNRAQSSTTPSCRYEQISCCCSCTNNNNNKFVGLNDHQITYKRPPNYI